MEKHILLAFATSKYENYSESFQRKILSEVLTSVVDLFTKKLKIYNRDLADIAENPSKSDLENKLDDWIASEQRDSSDWVVLYYTGHGAVIGSDSLHLLTRDTVPGHVAKTAFSLKKFADMILEARPGRPRRPGRMLIIIDTCFAGTAALEFADQFRKMLLQYQQYEIYLLSATQPSEEAQAGALATALVQSIEELSTRSITPSYFSVEDVMEQINIRLKTQRAFFTSVTITGLPQFFPNPSFADTGGRAVFANEAQRAILDQEFREHWGPRSRGIEFDTQAGDYFSGREAALAAIRAYLSDAAMTRPLVITGRPGAGKSAILARVVARSREKLSGIPALDIAVHAKGKTLADVVTRVAGATGAKPVPKDIVEALAQSGKATRIVVDALDEAAEPEAIAEALLQPVGASGRVRLVVGSREHCVPLLGDVDTVNIDLPQYANDADIAEYAKRRLLREDEPNAPTPYADKHELAQAAAAMIAKRADKNFLVARLLVEDLLLRPQALDTPTLAAMALPAKVVDAFDSYLARFGERETMVRDLLLPLAYAEGKGFPWGNVWARVASELSGRTYGDDDIRWLLKDAGAFILEGLEDGQAVYRLYHLALQEALRSRQDDHNVQGKLTGALVECVPRFPEGGKDWLLANGYIRRHIPAHAPAVWAVWRLDQLLLDPMFVVAAIPGGLLPVLRNASKAAQPVSRVYKMAAHHWDAKASPGTWAAYLEFTARKLGLVDVAERFAALSISRQWRIPWVSLAPASAHLVLRGHQEPVRALAMISDTVISASDDGTIRCWDIETGELKRKPFRGHEGSIHALAAGVMKNREVIVSGGEDSTVRIWSLQTGIEILPAMRGHEGAVYAILLAVLDGNSVIISGGYDGTIRFWNAATGGPMQTPIRAHGEWIRALALCNVEGKPILISTGDSGSIRAWDALNGKLIAEGRSTNVVNALACFELNGNTVLASANHNGRIEIWDPRTMKPVSASSDVAYSSIFSLIAVKFWGPALITGDIEGVIRIWRGATLESVWRPITEHDMGVFALASDSSRAFIISGGLDGTVRLWDVGEAVRKTTDATFGQDSDVWSVAASRSIVVARSYDRRIRAFWLSTGEFLGEIPSGAGNFERAMAVAEDVSGPMLAFDMSGEIFAGNLTKPSSEMFRLGSLGRKAHALLFHGTEPTEVLTAVSGDGQIKSWNVSDRKLIRDLGIDIHRGWHDLPEQWTDTLAIGILGEARPVIVSGGSGSGLLRVWGADTGKLIREIPVSQREQILTTGLVMGSHKLVEAEVSTWSTALAIGTVGDDEWIASGDSDGTLTLWDAKSFEQIASVPGESSILALDIASISGHPALVWGGKDHMLHAWWPETNRRESLDVGFPVNAIAIAPDEAIITGTAHGIIAIRFESLL
jgi:WD40 repeat protein